MRTLIQLFLILLCLTSTVVAQDAERQAVSEFLDSFHQAGARADESYFDYFAADGVYLGTDATERWNLEEFRAYLGPYFGKGKGLEFTPGSRQVLFSSDGSVAWFDESLSSESMGDLRGTGVLVKLDGRWRVSQYHLTVPIPNALLDDVLKVLNQ